MGGQSSLVRTAARASGLQARRKPSPSYVCWQCRAIQISASPTTESPRNRADAFATGGPRDTADARFEVLGSPYSLLSVSLSASQKLYTRRGTLVSVAGKVENAQSTLSLLSPLLRLPLGVPFLYQRISSTSPLTALIATRAPNTTFTVLHLDGTTDWVVAQRNALLAWTGHTLAPSPGADLRLPLAHWGHTRLTGRGLAALAAPGNTYQLSLAEGEEMVIAPGHVVAYAEVGRNSGPEPFRLRSTSLRLQVPAVPSSITTAVGRLVPEGVVRFWNAARGSDTYKFLAKVLFALRTAARRSIWGDRLFVRFRGPATVLVSSRGLSAVREVMGSEEVLGSAEVADTEAGAVPKAIGDVARWEKEEQEGSSKVKKAEEKPVKIHVAAVGKDGKVSFEDGKDLREFVR